MIDWNRAGRSASGCRDPFAIKVSVATSPSLRSGEPFGPVRRSCSDRRSLAQAAAETVEDSTLPVRRSAVGAASNGVGFASDQRTTFVVGTQCGSLKLTAICIVDRTRKIQREGAVHPDPEAIALLAELRTYRPTGFEMIPHSGAAGLSVPNVPSRKCQKIISRSVI